MSHFASLEDISFSYPGQRGRKALFDISFELRERQHLAIVGANGSGKSSLAQILALLMMPDEGSLFVLNEDALVDEVREALRPHLGIVFQNPDNQIVATTVEEDVAFGPENLGVPHPELRQRVDEALKRVGLLAEAKREPTALSGGQKQKLAIAGVLSMIPKAIILDEATSMLDPYVAGELFSFVLELAEREGLTLINITHSMDEALKADEVLLLHEGTVAFYGTPKELFTRVDNLAPYGLRLPQELALQKRLGERFPKLFSGPYLEREAFLKKLLEALEQVEVRENTLPSNKPLKTRSEVPSVLEASRIFYTYQKNSPLSREALRDISFDLKPGEVLAVLGPSGAGKSTLMLHLNGLLEPQEGRLLAFGEEIKHKRQLRALRQRVGLVFQYPESQLFAETVFEDIAFGPKQMGLKDDEIKRRVKRAMDHVGLSEDFNERSPFELSGGEMRRVAIAGILAMETEVLILDEPSAGLDPQNTRRMIQLLKKLKQEGTALILVTHQMQDAAELADRVLLLEGGRMLAFEPASEVFYNDRLLTRASLKQTGAQAIMREVNQKLNLKLKPQSFKDVLETLTTLLLKAGHEGGTNGR